MRELDTLLAGLFITRAAISGVSSDGFYQFLECHTEVLGRLIDENATPLGDRLSKASGRYRLI